MKYYPYLSNFLAFVSGFRLLHAALLIKRSLAKHTLANNVVCFVLWRHNNKIKKLPNKHICKSNGSNQTLVQTHLRLEVLSYKLYMYVCTTVYVHIGARLDCHLLPNCLQTFSISSDRTLTGPATEPKRTVTSPNLRYSSTVQYFVNVFFANLFNRMSSHVRNQPVGFETGRKLQIRP